LHYLPLLFERFATPPARKAPPGFSIGEPGNPRADCGGTFSSGHCFGLIFAFSFCLDECAMGFPDSSCLFFDLIPFIYLLS